MAGDSHCDKCGHQKDDHQRGKCQGGSCSCNGYVKAEGSR
jgi:hypothetical protein